MDIRSCKISTTKDKSASRSGLAALAELMRKLGLDSHFERLMPCPGSSRGLRPGAHLTTFMLMMHEGSRHPGAAAHAARPDAGEPPAAGGRGGVSGRLGLAERAQLRVRPPVRARPAQGRRGASRPHRRGRLPGEDHQPLHEPGNRLRDPRQARPKRGRADRGAGQVAAAALHRARRGGEPCAADGAVPALDERHARSVRGGRAAEAKVRPAGARARLPAGRRHPVAGRLHITGRWRPASTGGATRGRSADAAAGATTPKTASASFAAASARRIPVQRLRCQRAAFRAVHARLQPVRADAPGAGRELRVDAHRALSPPALLQGGQDRAPCPRAGLEAVRRAGGAAA